ncbi:MAG: NDP-sugar synthase [Methanocellales archaeon]|nr:NDP-sugar synthase [Methanocellales archaeon]
MKACIMCGGEGTRMRPLTFERPKPCIPILNKPSIGYLCEHLSISGFNEIVLTLKYLGNKIEEYIRDGSIFGVRANYVYEKEKLGTAGSVKNSERYLKDEPFLVIGGDHVLDFDLREMYQFHKDHEGMITMGLMPVDNPQKYGIVDINMYNKIQRFIEKPKQDQIFSNIANTGIYVCNPELLEWIPSRQYDFAKDLFPRLLQEKEPIYGWMAEGYWTDIGDPIEYMAATRWKLDNLSKEIEGQFYSKNASLNGPMIFKHSITIGSNSSIADHVIIGENTKIGDNVLIGPYTSIGRNCLIGDSSKILSSYIYDEVQIGKGSLVSSAIIDNNTNIGEDCTLESGVVIGPRVMIQNEVIVNSDVRIWPEAVLKSGDCVKKSLINEKFGISVERS